MTRARWILPAAIAVVGVVPALLLWSRLPEEIATGWDGSGDPNGHGDRLVGMGGPAIFSAVLAVALAWALRRVPPRFVVAMVLGSAGGMAAAVSLMTALANRDVTAWPDAQMSALAVLAKGLALVLGGGLTVLVLNDRWATPRRGVAPTTAPTTGARSAWSGTAHGRGAFAVTVAFGAYYFFSITLNGGYLLGAVLLPAGVTIYATCASVRVTVGAHGLTARSPIGWPAVTIPLADIERVETETLAPTGWGGWGYRGSLRVKGNAAWIVRRGEGIVLHLADDRRFAVTVDDAEAAAETLSDQIPMR